jgi:hypothetical protein
MHPLLLSHSQLGCGRASSAAQNPLRTMARALVLAALLGESLCLQTGAVPTRPAVMNRAATPLMQQRPPPTGPFVGPKTTPLLDQVDTPSDMKSFSVSELKQLSHELRCARPPLD